MKRNAQTNQTKPINKSNETQTNPRRNAHTQHNRERDCKRKRECERKRKRGFDLWWPTERFEMVAVAIGSRSVGGVDERRRWQRGVESEGLFESLVLRVIDLSLVVRVSNRFFQFRVFFVVDKFWPIEVYLFIYNFFIYTKPRATFYKTQLRMNWSCV